MKMYEQLKIVNKIADLIREELKNCQVYATVDHFANTYTIYAYTEEHEYRMSADIPEDTIKSIAREVTEFLYGFTISFLSENMVENGVVMTSLHKWFFGE